MIASSPLLALIALVGFGTTFGLLAGGLLPMRPDHIRLITRVRSALRHDHWAVVAHPPRQSKRPRSRPCCVAAPLRWCPPCRTC